MASRFVHPWVLMLMSKRHLRLLSEKNQILGNIFDSDQKKQNIQVPERAKKTILFKTLRTSRTDYLAFYSPILILVIY